MSEKNIFINITSSNQIGSDLDSLPKISIDAEGYESQKIIPYKGDGTLKNDLGVILLKPISTALEQDKIKESQLTIKQIKEFSKDKRNADFFFQERLSNQIDDLKLILIPTLLTMIASFGITKASELVLKNKDKILESLSNKKCPEQNKIDTLIKNKNKLVKQINNTLKLIDSTTKALGISGGVIEGLDIAYNALKNLPIPSSTGVPGVPGIPINVILAIQDNKDKIDKLIGKLKKININILPILILLRQILLQVVQLLNLLDQLVQDCYPDANQEQIALDLINLTNIQSNQQSPIITNVNGFEIKTETEITNFSLKRKRAIAKNKQGITMLKGEFSFSSIDQILIDELVFYIQQNDLKAD